ncbi:histidine kinase [Streptomyces sp. OfavH-34-F]|uniref:sensor histidine kinase n=1 Tax=Streptomyces sp. OfavH-34-F TaxID=2917760 RepID=UPI001EF1A55E|nr:histidine kinase [Streptomyces sp. OfavH-34-F]MCG7527231.1 histidine kinase [Streptomyces sp. OfavH-34-F]
MSVQNLRSGTSVPLLRASLGRWRERDALLKDGLLALALTLLALVPPLSQVGAQIGDLPERAPSALSGGLILAQTAPLMIRRRWPAACLAVIAAAFAAHQVLGYTTTFASVGLYLALYSAGAHQVRARTALAALAVAGYAGLAAALHRSGSPNGIPDYLAFSLAPAAAWLVGNTVRTRRTEETERRRLAAEMATAAERARIARELHDVVTHHVTAMVVQADAAQYLLTSAPERAGEGLTAVSDTGRRALTELRYLLGVLEATGEAASAQPDRAGRAPALGQVGDLVEQARRSGQPVEFSERGERRPQGVDVELAAYRVAQEALTNAMKYAPGQPTWLLLGHAHDRVEIVVTTDGPATAPPAREPGAGGGRGLAGLRTRVRMLDGELTYGPRPEGGFEVRATIPSRPLQE